MSFGCGPRICQDRPGRLAPGPGEAGLQKSVLAKLITGLRYCCLLSLVDLDGKASKGSEEKIGQSATDLGREAVNPTYHTGRQGYR